MLKFEDYKKCLFGNEYMLKSRQRFKSENHEVYTENINKIALSSNDDKRIVALDRVILMDVVVKLNESVQVLHQRYLKGSVGIIRSKIFKKIDNNN